MDRRSFIKKLFVVPVALAAAPVAAKLLPEKKPINALEEHYKGFMGVTTNADVNMPTGQITIESLQEILDKFKREFPTPGEMYLVWTEDQRRAYNALAFYKYHQTKYHMAMVPGWVRPV